MVLGSAITVCVAALFFTGTKSAFAVSSAGTTPIVAITATAAPVLTFTADPASLGVNGETTLVWSATNAVSCIATSDAPSGSGIAWEIASPPSGSIVQEPPSGTTAYTMTCSGPGGSVSRTVTVTVSPSAAPVSTPVYNPPTVSVFATPVTISAGQATMITWTSVGASSCVGSNSLPVSSLAASGSLYESPSAAGTYTYTITCSGAYGTSDPASAVVSVTPSTLSILKPGLPTPAPLPCLAGECVVGPVPVIGPITIETSSTTASSSTASQTAACASSSVFSEYSSVIQTILKANFLSVAASAAQSAGLHIASSVYPDDALTQLTITDPQCGLTLATVSQWEDLSRQASSTSSSASTAGFSGLSLLFREGLTALSRFNVGDIFQDPFSTAYGQSLGGGSVVFGNTTGQFAVCSLAGSNGSANIFVNPDGSIHGVSGGFNFSISDIDTGSTLNGEANAALSTLLAAGIPQVLANTANNQITVAINDDPDENANFMANDTSGLVGISVDTAAYQSNGTLDNSCTANFLGLNAGTLGQTSSVNIQNTITHELGHCFGLAHTSDPQNIMYGPSASGATQATDAESADLFDSQPLSFNAAQTQFFHDVAEGSQIEVDQCTPECSGGDVWVTTDGACEAQTDACPGPGSFFDETTQQCESCPSDTTWVPSLGECVDSGTSPLSGAICGGNQMLDPATNACECDAGYTANSDGTCTEATATECNPDDSSCSNPPPNSCPSGYELAPDGSCQVTGSGDCVDPSTGETASCADVCASEDPEPSWCASVPGTSSYCSENPDDASCSDNDGGDYCAQNPTDPDCASYCAENPDDPACIGQDNPVTDPSYCEENPDDPSCSSQMGGDGGGGSDDCLLDGSDCLDSY